MEIQPDFKELLELLNARSVEYLVVGAHALAFHGAPRTTGDLELWVAPTADNAAKIFSALTDFGFGDVGLTPADFTQPDQIVQLGFPPVRIDLITSLTGVTWDAAWPSRTSGRLAGIPVFYLNREQFIVNKRATHRKKDLADLEALGER
ncbi:MAG: hypothetical protein NTW14_13540 [bacterium]|nr:hypothetical protein [bacterium]